MAQIKKIMTIKTIMTEKEYRTLPNEILSYSQLKTFDQSRHKYYKRYVLEEQDDDSNQSALLGSIVDCLLTCPEEFDNRFHKMTGNAPTGQWGEYINQLSTTCRRFLKGGKFTIEFTDIMKIAFDEFKEVNPDKFKGKDFEYIVLNYSKEDSRSKIVPRDYFQQCLDHIDKTPVDLAMITRAEKVRESLVEGKYTSKYFQLKSSRLNQTSATTTDDIEVLSQFPYRFVYRGQEFKILIDRLEINHTTQTVTVYDIKCVWDSLGFDFTVFKDRYYLQASLYWTGVSMFIKEMLPGYTLNEDFFFIIADTTLNYKSCLYRFPQKLIQLGLTGFTDKRGRKWSGVNEIMDDILFCRENNDYKDSLYLAEVDGVVTIEI